MEDFSDDSFEEVIGQSHLQGLKSFWYEPDLSLENKDEYDPDNNPRSKDHSSNSTISRGADFRGSGKHKSMLSEENRGFHNNGYAKIDDSNRVTHEDSSFQKNQKRTNAWEDFEANSNRNFFNSQSKKSKSKIKTSKKQKKSIKMGNIKAKKNSLEISGGKRKQG